MGFGWATRAARRRNERKSFISARFVRFATDMPYVWGYSLPVRSRALLLVDFSVGVRGSSYKQIWALPLRTVDFIVDFSLESVTRMDELANVRKRVHV